MKNNPRVQLSIRGLLLATLLASAFLVWLVDKPRRTFTRFQAHLSSGNIQQANSMLTGASKIELVNSRPHIWLRSGNLAIASATDEWNAWPIEYGNRSLLDILNRRQTMILRQPRDPGLELLLQVCGSEIDVIVQPLPESMTTKILNEMGWND